MTAPDRQLQPWETARYDQALAAARADAAQPGSIVTFEDTAPAGARCCLCSCLEPEDDPDSPHRTPGYVCPNRCAEPAAVVIIVFVGRPSELRSPVCRGHLTTARRLLAETWQRLGLPQAIVETGWNDAP